MAIRVTVVDDEPKLRAVWERVIRNDPGMELAATLSCADLFVETMEQTRTDVALLDLTMPGKDPLKAITDLRDRFASCRVIVYSAHRDPGLVESAMAAGAWGYVDKFDRVDEVLSAMRRVAGGETVLPVWFAPTA